MSAPWWTSDVSSLKATRGIEQLILTVWSTVWVSAFSANEWLGSFWRDGSELCLVLHALKKRLLPAVTLHAPVCVLLEVPQRWLDEFFCSSQIINSCGSLTCIAYQMPHELGNILVGIRSHCFIVFLSNFTDWVYSWNTFLDLVTHLHLVAGLFVCWLYAVSPAVCSPLCIFINNAGTLTYF